MQIVFLQALGRARRVDGLNRDLLRIERWIVGELVARIGRRHQRQHDERRHRRRRDAHPSPSLEPSDQRVKLQAAVSERHGRLPFCAQATLGQVVLIQLAAAVDSSCPCPGFGQLGGAVMLRMGMEMMLSGSHTGKS